MTTHPLEEPARPPEAQPAAPAHSPGRRAWDRFRANRLGWGSLCVFAVLLALCSLAELVSTFKVEGSDQDTAGKTDAPSRHHASMPVRPMLAGLA